MLLVGVRQTSDDAKQKANESNGIESSTDEDEQKEIGDAVTMTI